MEIEYWIRAHDHSLRLQINDQFSCQKCDSIVKGPPFYFCDSCTGFRVHKSCAEPPHQIRHPFHPHSFLTFLPGSIVCSNCFKLCPDGYRCGTCEYKLDSECALMPLATSGSEGQDWIRGLHHVHPLLRVDGGQGMKCIACKSTSHQDDLYGCSKCEYFLHKSCSLRPPQQLHLPVHRHHRGALIRDMVNPFVCRMCEMYMEDKYNLAYWCRECSLSVCFKCAEVAWTRSESIKYEDHDHLLCLVEDIKGTASHSQCDSKDAYCVQRAVTSSDEFRRTESTMLWCYLCGFRVHLLCAPLPSTVKHELHIHSLVLVESMREDDSGEYYCDICETERDPLIRLYCCQECKFYAHVHCLLPEILKLLGGGLKNVALKTVNQDLRNVPNSELQIERVDSTLTLKDAINQLSEDEKESNYKCDVTISGDEEIDETHSPKGSPSSSVTESAALLGNLNT